MRQGDSEEGNSGMSRGKGKGKGRGRSQEAAEAPVSGAGSEASTGVAIAESTSGGDFITTVTAIEDGKVTFGSEGGSAMGKGKGRRGSGGASRTLPLADVAVVTTGTLARRTSQFQPGAELAGGVENRAFEALKDGGSLRARLVIDPDSESIVELNVIVADTSVEEAIAVKPKRPPQKPLSLP